MGVSKKRAKKFLPATFPTPTSDQRNALAVFSDWFDNKGYRKKPILKIGGYSGVGKSVLITFIKYLYNFSDSDCYVVAYTGQAVNVLRQRGIHAKTIHSTFMQATEVPLRDKGGRQILRDGIPLMATKWKPVKAIPSKVKLIICDEYSFVPEELQDLMLRYNCPILAIGDPFQLPPVVGKPCFKMEDLDYVITEIMRQAQNSEIVDLATRIRNFDRIPFQRYGNQVYFCNPKSTIEDTFTTYRACFKCADTVITSTNKQRQIINDMYRKVILKTDSPYPIAGEHIICRRNDWQLKLGDYPLTNGTIGRCLYDISRSAIDRKSGVYTMDFQPDYIENDFFDNLVCNFKFLDSPFGDKEITKYDVGHMMEYAHAITCHLSQGLTTPTALFMDSYRRDQEYMAHLRYTAVTRAQKWLTYVLPYENDSAYY